MKYSGEPMEAPGYKINAKNHIALLVADRTEPCEPASRIRNIKSLSRGNGKRLLIISP